VLFAAVSTLLVASEARLLLKRDAEAIVRHAEESLVGR